MKNIIETNEDKRTRQKGDENPQKKESKCNMSAVLWDFTQCSPVSV
jgi:hypothetical protein